MMTSSLSNDDVISLEIFSGKHSSYLHIYIELEVLNCIFIRRNDGLILKIEDVISRV